MKTSLIWRMIGLFAVAWSAACSTTATGAMLRAADPDDAVNADATDADPDASGDGSATDTGDQDPGQPDPGDQDPGQPDPGDVPRGGPCTRDTDCAPSLRCADGTCQPSCDDVRACDDRNVCTRDTCQDGVCVYTAAAPELADVTPHDCRKPVCEDGALRVDVIDPLDLPADDGVDCTEERCVTGFPWHQPRHQACDDGDPSNGEEACSTTRGCEPRGGDPCWEEITDPGWWHEERCGDGQDDNGDGAADEGCDCAFGSVQRCYLGPPSSRAVGACVDGIQVCQDRLRPHWSPCENGTLPAGFIPGQPESRPTGAEGERCDMKDNNCNQCIDEVPDCEPMWACPDEDTAQPLSDYALNGPGILPGIETIMAWRWTVRGPPNSATSGPEDADAAITSVFLDVSGDYRVSLVVTDVTGNEQQCDWVVHVAGSGLRVEMRWDTAGSVDMDLHLHRPGTTTDWCDPIDDCHHANCRLSGSGLSWGYPESGAGACGGDHCWNPRLEIDNVRSLEPENINLDNPRDGDVFRIMAHMFSGSLPTHPVVTIHCGGRIRAILGESPDAVNLTTAGLACRGETWRVADVAMQVDAGVTGCAVTVLSGAEGAWDVREDDPSY